MYSLAAPMLQMHKSFRRQQPRLESSRSHTGLPHFQPALPEVGFSRPAGCFPYSPALFTPLAPGAFFT